MARKVSDECDILGCNSVHTPTNHWFQVRKALAGNIIIEPYNEEEIDFDYKNRVLKGEKSTYILLCGEECVHKYISQNLASLHPTIKVSLCPEGCCCFKCNETRANEECTEYAKTCIVEFNSDNKVEPLDLPAVTLAQDDILW